MARVKTNSITVKVSETPEVKIKVGVECANVSTLSRAVLEALYASQWKQYMYSEVQQTVKSMYPAVATNLAILAGIKASMPNATDEQVSTFIKMMEVTTGNKFNVTLPNLFSLGEDHGEFKIEYSVVAPTDELDELPDLTEEEVQES